MPRGIEGSDIKKGDPYKQRSSLILSEETRRGFRGKKGVVVKKTTRTGKPVRIT